MKKIVMGRKNYLFMGSKKEGRTVAIREYSTKCVNESKSDKIDLHF